MYCFAALCATSWVPSSFLILERRQTTPTRQLKLKQCRAMDSTTDKRNYMNFDFGMNCPFNNSGITTPMKTLFFILNGNMLQDTEGTLSRVHSQSTIYLFNWSPVSLQCVYEMFYLSTRDWSDLLCLKTTINYWHSVFCDNYEYVSPSGEYLIFKSRLFCLTLMLKLDFFFVIDVLILLSILEYSPLAHVAHNISPVPVLNCELLNGPEPCRDGVLSFHGSF